MHMPNRRQLFGKLMAILATLASGLFAAVPARASLVIACPSCTVATVGGTTVVASPTGLPPTISLSRNPNAALPLGQSNVTPLVLIPDNTPNGATLDFNVTLSQAGSIRGTGNTAGCDLPCLAPTLGLPAKWSVAGSNFLTDYLGDAQPSGPPIAFDDLLAATRAVDPGASGYFVYTPLAGAPIQFGTGTDAEVIFGGIGGFPVGTIIEAFLIDLPSNNQFGGGVSRDATGGALFVGATSVPEPSTLMLVLASLFILRPFIVPARSIAALLATGPEF